MIKIRNSEEKLIIEVINKGNEFEALMDSTDFDSWLEKDSNKILIKEDQDIQPFQNYNYNKKHLLNICLRLKMRGTYKFSKDYDYPSLAKYLINRLFISKIKRLDAKVSSVSTLQVRKYEECLRILLTTLINLQISKVDGDLKIIWFILLYNDLSIAFAGLEESSISRGYAEDARKLIEKDNSYKEFDKLIYSTRSHESSDIINHKFITSKLYDLYIIALYNQAQAERRSYLKPEAEYNYLKIIYYIEKVHRDINFNYYSALLNLSDLYRDLGRGKEALECLEKVLQKKNEDDIRYYMTDLLKINVLIDQSEYDEAEDLLENNFFIKDGNNGYRLNKKHKITHAGFKALKLFAICKIEHVNNTLKIPEENKIDELKKAKKVIKDNIDTIVERKQEGFKLTAYKHLSDIYKVIDKDKVTEYLTKFISKEDKIENLRDFVSHPKMNNCIDECDDLDALESFLDQIIKGMNDNYRDLLKMVKENIIKECVDKGQLCRAERIAKKVDRVLARESTIKYRGEFFNNSCGRGNLTKEEIIKRLDINEKQFDLALFHGSNIKEYTSIAEVIVLRRWNSYSPGLLRETMGSLGGGYLLRIKKKYLKSKNAMEKEENMNIENIVIDPGYNFIENFRSEGFCIEDIDTIIVTHSHLDHCAELLPIMDLMHQINKRYTDISDKERPRKRVKLCLSKGAYNKFFSYINDPDWKKQLKDVIILENLDNQKWKPYEGLGLEIIAIKTPHWDIGGVNAIGLIVELEVKAGNNEEKTKTVRIGITGDTPWYDGVTDHFKGCDILCVHLGSIKYQEIGFTDDRNYLKGEEREIFDGKEKEFEEIYNKSNHLLFFGTENIISYYNKTKKDSLIIVSEFGEELKYGLRVDLCHKLLTGKSIDCLPGDIGQYIIIEKDGTKKVRCNYCKHFIKPKEINTYSYGREDAIQYICQTCDNTLTELQKQAFIEHRVTRH